MAGQNDRWGKKVTSQEAFLAGHCPVTGRYFEPCIESFVSISEEHFSPNLKARLWEVPTTKVLTWFSIIVFLSDEEPTLETLNFVYHIGKRPNYLYFDLVSADDFLSRSYLGKNLLIALFQRRFHQIRKLFATVDCTGQVSLANFFRPDWLSVMSIMSDLVGRAKN